MRAALLVIALGSSLSGCPRSEAPAVKPEGPSSNPQARAPIALPPQLRLPDEAVPLAYDLRLELDPEREAFSGHVAIRVRLAAPTDRVWLHHADLEIAAASYRAGARTGTLVDVAPTNPADLHAYSFGTRLAGEVELVFDYTAHTAREAEGLFRERAAGRWYLFSQGESMFARRILPCFDEPRFKASWTVAVDIPDGLVALGNGPVAHETLRSEHRREVRFAEVGAMASYLFAIAVGPFELTTVGALGRAKVPVRIATVRGNAPRAAAARANVGRIIDALERYLDAPLPWPKLDLVEVPELFGAMENVGLVTFDSSALVGDASDLGFVRRFIRFAAHELAHQWFGNWVTFAWWDDLWLSEGLATWMGDKISIELGAYDDVDLRTQLGRERALDADGAADARPLHRAIVSTDDPDARFDAIAYEKGSAVLTMFEHFVGEATFRAAIRAYVRARANSTATSSDFLAALRTTAGEPVARAFATYLETAGTPIVELAVRCQDGGARVDVHARDRGAVPVCVRHPGGEACALAMDRAEIALPSCPAWLVGNAGGRGYYRATWLAGAEPKKMSAAPLTASERLARGDDIAAALVRGEVTTVAATDELRALAASRDLYDHVAATTIAVAIDHLVEDASRPAWTSWLGDRLRPHLAREQIFAATRAVEHELRDRVVTLVPAARFDPAVLAFANGVVDKTLAAKRDVAADYPTAIALAAPSGGRALFDRVVAAAAAADDDARTETLLESLGAFGPDLAPDIVALVGDVRWKPSRVWPAVAALFERSATRTAAWRALRDRLPKLLAQLAPVEAGELIDATKSLCDHRAEVVASFEPRLADIVNGRARLDSALAAIDRCSTRRTALGDITAALH